MVTLVISSPGSRQRQGQEMADGQQEMTGDFPLVGEQEGPAPKPLATGDGLAAGTIDGDDCGGGDAGGFKTRLTSFSRKLIWWMPLVLALPSRRRIRMDDQV